VNTRKLISGLCGAAVVLLAIWLDARGNRLESQIFVMTAFVLGAPVALAIIAETYRKRWFFSVAIVASIHIVVLWSIRRQLPFQSLGVAIIWGAVESVVATFAIVKMAERGA
jgi:hypothetical protein